MEDEIPANLEAGPDAYELARHYVDAGRIELAEEVAKRELAKDPNHPLGHLILGRCELARKRPKDALLRFENGLAVAPEFGLLHLFRALTLRDLGRFPDAEAAVLAALRLDAEDSFALATYAQIMLDTGVLGKAEQLIQRALALDPDKAYFHTVQSAIQSAKLRDAHARAAAQNALRLDPDDDTPHIEMGLRLFETGRPFAARRALREALRIDPSNESVQKAFLQVDMACRWTYLPAYYLDIALRHVPGKQFTLWIGLVLLLKAVPDSVIPMNVKGLIAIVYLVICVHTWIATPLTKLWLKVRPPRWN